MASARESLIAEVLKDYYIAEESRSIVIECRLSRPITLEDKSVSGTWYKDGIPIYTTDKIVIVNKGLRQTLEIKDVTKEDQGIYSYHVKTTSFNVYTKCNIYVKLLDYDNGTIYYDEPPVNGLRVNIPIRNCYNKEGQKFNLFAEFDTNVESCTWFRNNTIISAKYPRSLHEYDDHSVTKLFFENSKRTDSGVYEVVAKTYDNKFITNFADVLIADDYTDTLYNNETIPHIWESPTDLSDIYEGDDVDMIFKVTYDSATFIEWTKDGEFLKMNDKIKSVTYGSQYIGLKLFNVEVSDSGKYFLILRHALTTISKLTSVVLFVNTYPDPLPPPGAVRNNLRSPLVSVGNGVTLRCSFVVPRTEFTYVAWTVGSKKIERSDTRFKVMCGEEDFLLHIPVVTPEMAGEVTCQLRKHVAPQQSILISKTSSYLAVLPPQIIDEAVSGNGLLEEHSIFYKSFAKIPIPFHPSINLGYKNADVYYFFEFCKIDTERYFFEVMATEEQNPKEDFIFIRKQPVLEPNPPFPSFADYLVNWTKKDDSDWYAIDLYQNNNYIEIGASDVSCLEIKNPPEDKIFKFRVRKSRPRRNQHDLNICFIAEEEALRNVMRRKDLLAYKEFQLAYEGSPATNIGTGSFGCVNLMRRRDGIELAIKQLGCNERYMWRSATREFNIVKHLYHQNIVLLIDGFSNVYRSGIIFAMEYLWGDDFTDDNIDREHLNEEHVLLYVRQILMGLEYLHTRSIAHLDLTPQNIVFQSRNSRIIKIIDFGMARNMLQNGVEMPIAYGAPDFVSPEMLHNQALGCHCDMWSLGAISYWLLTGRKPFRGRSLFEITTNITTVNYNYDDINRVISDRARTFVSYLLRRHSNGRLTALAALGNDWITQGPNNTEPVKILVRGHYEMIMVTASNNAQWRWKRIMFVVLAVVRFLRRLLGSRFRNRPRRRYSARLLNARRRRKYQ